MTNYEIRDKDDDGMHVFKHEFKTELEQYQDTGLTPAEVAELAQAKADGRIVVLPCKVGIEIYMLCDYSAYYDNIEKTKITGISVFLDNNPQITTALGLCFKWNDCINKTVFLTKAEAQAAINKMEVVI